VDYADDDAVRRFEMWELALAELYLDGWLVVDQFHGDSSIVRMKREALINAARIEGDAHLPRIQKAFPSVQLAPLVQALRAKFVEVRLGGTRK